MTYTKISCPSGPLLASIGTTVTLVAKLRPSWIDGEAVSFGLLDGDPSYNPLNTCAFIVDIQSHRIADGSISTYLGASSRVGSNVFDGAAYGSIATLPQWVEIAATYEINTNPRRMRLFYRYAAADPWTAHAERDSTGAATGFDFTKLATYSTGALTISNRQTGTWEGGISALSLRNGITGTGVSAEPGGTEIAEWHATPPTSTYTDPYANNWTVTGPDWRFTTVAP